MNQTEDKERDEERRQKRLSEGTCRNYKKDPRNAFITQKASEGKNKQVKQKIYKKGEGKKNGSTNEGLLTKIQDTHYLKVIERKNKK